MIVAHVTREFGELLGAGGLRDNVKGICVESSRNGINTHVFVPLSPSGLNSNEYSVMGEPMRFDVRMNLGKRCRRTEVVEVRHYRRVDQPNLCFHFVTSDRYDHLCEGDGTAPRRGVYTYTPEDAEAIGRPDLTGKRYNDNFELNVLLIKASLRAMGDLSLKPDLIHCHDGHTGLLPLIAQHSIDSYASFLRYTPTLLTLHNAADRYRGQAPLDELAQSLCGIPAHILKGCLHNDQLDPVLAAALFGTALNTISENYARELRETGLDWTTSWLGHRLAGLGISLEGITSGINPEDYDPSDPARMGITARFSPASGDLAGKKVCKRILVDEIGLGATSLSAPLLTFVGRLVCQKGLDFLADAIDAFFREDSETRFVGIGTGSMDVVRRLKRLERCWPSRVRVITPYDRVMANKIYAAGDFCLMPSRFEPCGLVDFIAQLYGNLPVVHAIGGLVKVVDGVTGFTYQGGSRELLEKLREVTTLDREQPECLDRMRVEAARLVLARHTWTKVFSDHYLPLYQAVICKNRSMVPVT